MISSPFRALPGVDTLLASPELAAAPGDAALHAEAARAIIASARLAIAHGEAAAPASVLARRAAAHVRASLAPRLVRVVNATGIIVHTNLGRAPLLAGALDGALGAINIEYDLDAGARGSRRALVEPLLRTLSGAEAALVVNNNAAAIVLALAALAHGREVIISRGELVEIGANFRIPEILEASGARLREVGTTNRTYARDYAAAIGPETAALLRVHPSNFRITGFTARPTTAELGALARERALPLLGDLGSGTFAPLPPDLLADADPRAELAAGADLVCLSGDKLLGGPQAGLILGRRELVERLARHPLARAFRPGKLTLAALEATLLAYRAGQPERVPTWKMIHATPDELAARAHAIAATLVRTLVGIAVVSTAPCTDAVGGGSHAGQTLPGHAVVLAPVSGGPGASALARALRRAPTPIVGVVSDGAIWLHLRTVASTDDATLAGVALRNGLVVDTPAYRR